MRILFSVSDEDPHYTFEELKAAIKKAHDGHPWIDADTKQQALYHYTFESSDEQGLRSENFGPLYVRDGLRYYCVTVHHDNLRESNLVAYRNFATGALRRLDKKRLRNCVGIEADLNYKIRLLLAYKKE